MVKISLPSVMFFHARYRTPTAAVSSTVATKEPSTFADVPCRIEFKIEFRIGNW